jgi:hypothetical protein
MIPRSVKKKRVGCEFEDEEKEVDEKPGYER